MYRCKPLNYISFAWTSPWKMMPSSMISWMSIEGTCAKSRFVEADQFPDELVPSFAPNTKSLLWQLKQPLLRISNKGAPLHWRKWNFSFCPHNPPKVPRITLVIQKWNLGACFFSRSALSSEESVLLAFSF